MTYKEVEKIIREKHLEEFNNLLPVMPDTRDKNELINWQISREFAVEAAINKIAEEHGYEIDDESIEDEDI